jgi:hypothetical protein
MRDLLRERLQDTYQIIDAGDPELGIPVQVNVDSPSGQERQRHPNHWTDGGQRT